MTFLVSLIYIGGFSHIYSHARKTESWWAAFSASAIWPIILGPAIVEWAAVQIEQAQKEGE